MTSGDRLREVMNSGDNSGDSRPVLSSESVRASLGKVGLSPADRVMAELDIEVSSPKSELDRLKNRETAEAFENSLRETEKLFGRVDIMVPSFEEIIRGSDNGQGEGIDLTELARFYEYMNDCGASPEIAIAPQGLSLDDWFRIYRHMTPERDNKGRITKNAPGMPKRNSFRGRGFACLSEEIEYNWEAFNPLVIRRANNTIVPSYIDANGYSWSIRIIPSRQRLLEGRPDITEDKKGVNPTLAELLSVYGQCFQRGELDFLRVSSEGVLAGEETEIHDKKMGCILKHTLYTNFRFGHGFAYIAVAGWLNRPDVRHPMG